MRRLAIAIVTGTVLGAVSTASIAQAGLSQLTNSVRSIEKNFDVADKNHDGKLTREEAQSGATPAIAKHFDEIDTDHKGYVTKADTRAFIQSNLLRGHAAPPSSSAGH
ncbi:EF-hand domain-containing protein [Dyella sp. GSA-30]|uniref:EF-hand domain-containing protein n=1 Tax=Dyella sp. GSA-30 TaxID=2994496 RepID=UPI0024905180|nr:EF-hand domain-containing protein [Dyella sp. GSA-30]